MKLGLVTALVLVLVLLGSLALWRTRSAEAAEPDVAAPDASAEAEPAVELSAGPQDRAEAPELASPAESIRSAGGPAPQTPPGLEADLASATDEVFALRYEGKSREERRAARASLEALLEASPDGDDPDLRREIEWLRLHEAP